MKLRSIPGIILLFLTLSVSAQNNSVPIFNSMPYYGIDLNKGWKFNPNDNPDFAKPAFDDAKWDTINPITPTYQLPQLKTVKTGWLRLHFKVGDALAGKAMTLAFSQYCASELYLDGKFLVRYGVLSDDPDKVVPLGFNQISQELKLVPGKEHVLAIRFSPWKSGFNLRNNSEFLWFTIMDFHKYEDLITTTHRLNQIYTMLCAVFFLLSLLHLSFNRYDPTQRANLYFSVYTILSTIGFVSFWLLSIIQDARVYGYAFLVNFVMIPAAGIFMLRGLSFLFSVKVSRLVKVLWVMYALYVVTVVFYGIDIYYRLSIYLLVGTQTYIVIMALKSRKRGAAIIATGVFISLLILLVTDILPGILPTNRYMSQFIDIITYLAPALGIAIYLAREFALDSSLLREKVVEVETLSAQSIAQEQEKQLLLAGQNEALEKQVTQRTAELQSSLDNLKAAQTRLIQSEKMASLGELTAGIAHEIQNPLNFVNNFSEVSRELLAELTEELNAGNTEDVLAIAGDLDQNLEKINHHGKRADAIVKGMLQHSRTGGTVKEATNINKLADEYLRLAYHGLKAKQKNFNAELVTHFDDSLPVTKLVAQDIGRVLLNMFNNAFYAVNQKLGKANGDYKPEVSVRTLMSNNAIVIKIKDNGIGIPDAIKQKTMQPFFTTKPTGEGTGLGLSLSYDIIVKLHSGNIEVESVEGEFTEFVITLPVE